VVTGAGSVILGAEPEGARKVAWSWEMASSSASWFREGGDEPGEIEEVRSRRLVPGIALVGSSFVPSPRIKACYSFRDISLVHN
jgi:hypothetical protein